MFISLWSERLGATIRWAGFALLFLLPLIIGPQGSTPVAKLVTIHLASLVILGAAILKVMEDRGLADFGGRLRSTEWAALALIVAMAVATILSLDPAISFWGSKGRGLGLLTYLLMVPALAIFVRFLKSKAQLGSTFIALTSATVIVSIHALGQYLGFDLPVYRSVSLFITDSGQERAFATLGNPIHLTVYITITVALIGGWLIGQQHRPSVWHWLGLALAILATLASLAGHAGAAVLIFGVYLSSYLFLVIWLWLIKTDRRLRILQVATWLSLVGVVMVTVFTLWPQPLAPLTGLAKPFAESPAIAARFPNWAMARDVVFAHPFFGAGPETYGQTAHQYFDRRLAAASDYEARIDRAHQFGLDWLVTTGWAGWVAVLTLFGLGLRSGWLVIKNRDLPQWQKMLAAGGVFALLVYLGQMTINFSAHTDLVVIFLILFLLPHLHKPLPDEEIAIASLKKQVVFHGHWWGLGVVACLFLLTASWFVGWRLWLSELETKQGVDLAKVRQFDASIDQFRQAHLHAPFWSETDIFYAEALRRADKYREGVEVMRAAAQRHPAERRYLTQEGTIRLDWAEVDAAQIEPTRAFLEDAKTKTAFWTNIFRQEIRLAAISNDVRAAEAVKNASLAWAPDQYIDWDQEIGVNFVQTKHYETALPYLQKAAIQSNSTTLMALGYTYSQLDRLADAAGAYQRCTEVQPTNSTCWNGWFAAAHALGRQEEVDLLLTKLREVYPNQADDLGEVR